MSRSLPVLLVTICALLPVSAFCSLAEAVDTAGPEFSLHDMNADGYAEIRAIRDLRITRTPEGENRGGVLVIVEPRLLREGPRSEVPLGDLRPALETYADDLALEGWEAAIVSMQVYDGPVHQDGRTLLAVREYLRRIRELAPDLAGAVLVGSFPEAVLVRQYNWRQHRKTVLRKGGPDEEKFGDEAVYRVRSVPELVAGRGEIVLADLDGKWEDLYHIGPEQLPWVMAVYPGAEPPDEDARLDTWLNGGPTSEYETGTKTFTDFFFVNDGRYESTPEGGGINLALRDDLQDDECSDADKQRGNPMARPEIVVSRINALHIGLRPKRDLRGVNGEGLLDENGRPQTVTFADPKDVPRGLSVWERDPATERQLLLEFFRRNHRYRHGEFSDHLRPAAAAYGLSNPMGSLCKARADWSSLDHTGYECIGDDADLASVVRWLARPAVLRAVRAHSDPWGSSFKKVEDAADLEEACGGQAWAWTRRDNTLVPTLGKAGKLDSAPLRTLWQNGVLPDTANLFLHSGCDITRPGGVAQHAYNHSEYGYWQAWRWWGARRPSMISRRTSPRCSAKTRPSVRPGPTTSMWNPLPLTWGKSVAALAASARTSGTSSVTGH